MYSAIHEYQFHLEHSNCRYIFVLSTFKLIFNEFKEHEFFISSENEFHSSQISKPLTKTKMSIISFKSNVKGIESLPQTLVFKSQYLNNPIQTLDISNYDFCYIKSKFEISKVYIIWL